MLNEWVIIGGLVGIGLIPVVCVCAAIGWAIQDRIRNTHH